MCSSCGSGKIWRVGTMVERGAGGAVLPMRVSIEIDPGSGDVRGYGTFELYVCHLCGRVDWHARGLERLVLLEEPGHQSKSRAMRESRRCPRCSGHHIGLIPEARERTGDGVQALSVFRSQSRWVWTLEAGTFELAVCEGCGYTEWTAFKRHLLSEEPNDGIILWRDTTVVCEMCDATRIWRISTARELPGGRALTLPGGQGDFGIDVCDACGYSLWRLRAPQTLQEDPANDITRVDGVTNDAGGQGPYR